MKAFKFVRAAAVRAHEQVLEALRPVECDWSSGLHALLLRALLVLGQILRAVRDGIIALHAADWQRRDRCAEDRFSERDAEHFKVS